MDQKIKNFQEEVWSFYKNNKRDNLPWRKTKDPYKILVSEIMLQQTQVKRVIPKYKEFLKEFPTIKSLAKAPLSKVIISWQGLGYNRRAKFLKKAAEEIIKNHKGNFPKTLDQLINLPGIGNATAGAILTYAYNKRNPFIETNIRTVFIHHFFEKKETISDNELMSIIEKATPKENMREWHWALMDYGTHLKKTIGNLSKKSATYAKQSKFQGSRRQKRSSIIRELSNYNKLDFNELQKNTHVESNLLEELLFELIKEGMIKEKKKAYELAT